jgi:molybdenum cofactor cytidylyltransferase
VLRTLDVDCVLNPEPARGIGFSIACAVNATPPVTQYAGWCLLPADMPYVNAATTQRLVDALRGGADLVAPFHRGRRGHPVGFSASFHDALAALDGDTGARVILQQHADRLTTIAGDDAGVLADIDVLADLYATR